jgi:hypothetical protein
MSCSCSGKPFLKKIVGLKEQEMKRVMNIGWAICLVGLMVSCKEKEEEEPFNFQPCDCGNPTLQTVSALTGEIGFHDELGRYVIYRHIPNTIDSRQLFFLCVVPETFQVEGLQVRFTGEAKEPCNTPTDLTGAQQFFDLRIIQLQRE